MAEFGHDPIGYHKSVIRPVAILAVAMCLRAENPIENTGKPMRLPFECTEADTQAASLNCSEQEPCAVFLELSSVEAAGNKIFLAGNLHTNTTTLYSVLLATEDAGKTWNEPHPRIRFAGLDQIQFIDFQNGWIAGANLQSTARDPFLLITTEAVRPGASGPSSTKLGWRRLNASGLNPMREGRS